MPSNPQPLGIYIHIPYCVKKCPYCDFNSYGLDTVGSMPEVQYIKALNAELQHYAGRPEWQGRSCRSVFFGGGTPSLFSAESIETVLNTIQKHFNLLPDAEITMEANPGTIAEALDEEKLRELRRAGINRVSMGAQSFSPEKLKALGRIHRPQDVISAVRNLTSAGINNFNLDLIFGVHQESFETWRGDLKQALSFNPPHISLYALSIEPGTEFSRQLRKGRLTLPDDDTQADFYLHAVEVMEQHGYRRYEISNFARAGRECIHNLGYWDGSDYLGIGAGAHSFLSINGARWSNIPKPEHYIERALNRGDASQRRETVDAAQVELELIYTRLRTARGLSLEEYRETFKLELSERYPEELKHLAEESLAIIEDNHLRLTSRGFLFADYVAQRFA